MRTPERSLVSPRQRARLGLMGLAALVPMIVAMAAHAAPLSRPAGVIGTVPGTLSGALPKALISGPTTLYDNTGNPANNYYSGQGGNEAIDDLHMTAGGSLDTLVFECYDPETGGTFSATVKIYGNTGGLDLDTAPLIGTYEVTGIPRGRQIVSVPLPDAPVVNADIWVGVGFSSTTAGLIRKSDPTIGTSHDRYVENGVFYYDFGGNPKANFALRLVDSPNYTLTLLTVGSGTVTKDPDRSTYVDGTVVQLTPLPATHWHFVGWSNDASGADNPLSIGMNGDKTITATFAIDTYTLTYTPGSGGTITGVLSQTVSHGADGTQVTAVPNLGFHFLSWSDGRLTAARTDLGVTADLSVTATFAITTYTLTYTPGAGGTIGGVLSQTVDQGDDGTQVTAVPNVGYHFVSWSDGLATAARTDLNVIANLSVTATFAINTYTLTYTPGSGGTIGGTLSQTVDHGGNGTQVTAAPNLGLHFVSWSDGRLTAARTELNVVADLSVTATFAINTYTLTYTAGSGGTIGGTLSQTVNHGANGTQVTAAPNLGLHFVSWSDGVLTAARTDLNVVASLSVTATFARDNLACNGDFEVDLTRWAKYESVELTRVAPGRESGWSMQIKSKSSSDCGADDSPDCIAGTTLGNTYRYTAWVKAGSSSSRNRKVKLRIFEMNGSSQVANSTTEVALSSTEWRKLTLDYVVRRSGTSLSERFLYDPDGSGEYFFLDGVGIELLPPPPPPVTFTITATAGLNGSIAPLGPSIVNQGASKTYTITPNSGYQIQNVVLDGSTSVGAPSSYTFTNVQANRAIQASFAAIPPGLNLVTNPSFESGIQNWIPYEHASLSWNTTDGHTGGKSLKVTGGDASNGIDDSPNWVPRVAGVGVKYRFQVWVKAANSSSRGKVKIRVYELDGSSQVGSTVYSPESTLTNTRWIPLSAVFTVQRANTALSMRVTTSSSDQAFLVDDVSIERVTSTVALAQELTAPEPEAAVEFARPTVYPNPALGVATLGLSLAKPGVLKAELYDVAGRVVRVLANEDAAAAGTYRFALEGARGATLGAGIYFYRVDVAGTMHRGRFVVLD